MNKSVMYEDAASKAEVHHVELAVSGGGGVSVARRWQVWLHVESYDL